MPPPTVILRHPKERLSKCSVEPLRGTRPEITFHTAGPGFTFEATAHTLLAVEAPELSPEDGGRPLLLLDSTWRLLPKLEARLTGEPMRRSLPKAIRTAYPRVSKLAPDPAGGLATVEALYAAWRLLGCDDPSLLDDYPWRAAFLAQFA